MLTLFWTRPPCLASPISLWFDTKLNHKSPSSLQTYNQFTTCLCRNNDTLYSVAFLKKIAVEVRQICLTEDKLCLVLRSHLFYHLQQSYKSRVRQGKRVQFSPLPTTSLNCTMVLEILWGYLAVTVWALGSVCGAGSSCTISPSKLPVFANSVLPALKHRKLKNVQEACINMPGNQPGISFLNPWKWHIWMFSGKRESESQEKATLLQRGESVVICQNSSLLTFWMKRVWSKPKPGHHCNQNCARS